MKPIRFAQDVVTLAEFKAQAAVMLRRVAEQEQPLVITLNGKASGVVLSPAMYDRLLQQERELFLAEIELGEADIAAGRLLSTAEVKQRLAKQQAARARPRRRK